MARGEPRTAQKEEPPEPTIIYRDKVVYKEREKVVWRDRLPEECEKELKDLRKLTRYYEGYTQKLELEIAKQDKRISRLNEQLEKALNRERVAVMSRKDAQKELEKAFSNEVKKNLSQGIEVKNVKGLAKGFKIGPKDGGYQISFTADDFTNLIGEYLRPATKKILFGK